MTEEQTLTPQDDLAKARLAVLDKFWAESMESLLARGVTPAEAAKSMFAIAAGHLAKWCGERAASIFLYDGATYFARVDTARAEAIEEATSAPRH